MEVKEKKVRFDSDEAASIKTVTGWVSRLGRYTGQGEHNERQARWEGCTHVDCSKCGKEIEKSRTICEACAHKRNVAQYEAYLSKPWNGEDYIYSDSHDKYFSTLDEVYEYLEEQKEEGEETTLDDLMLVHCEPNYLPQVDHDTFSIDDIMPEDMGLEDVCNKDVLAKIAELNELIKKQRPISWSPIKLRIEL